MKKCLTLVWSGPALKRAAQHYVRQPEMTLRQCRTRALIAIGNRRSRHGRRLPHGCLGSKLVSQSTTRSAADAPRSGFVSLGAGVLHRRLVGESRRNSPVVPFLHSIRSDRSSMADSGEAAVGHGIVPFS